MDRLLDEAERRPLVGWDFAWLGDRISTRPLPWSFEEIVLRHARRSPDLLDLGTGGGEWLSALSHRPPRTVATEAWPPNVDVARARLDPLGVTVVAVEAAPDNVEQEYGQERRHLPFPAESFSLVVDRHESFVAREVARVLGPGGTFLTQQVGGDYAEFRAALGLDHREPRAVWDRNLATRQLEDAGLHVVEGDDGQEEVSFADVGAFAWYLKAIPWIVEGFTIADYRSRLERLHGRLEASGPITLRQAAFWLKALRPV